MKLQNTTPESSELKQSKDLTSSYEIIDEEQKQCAEPA